MDRTEEIKNIIHDIEEANAEEGYTGWSLRLKIHPNHLEYGSYGKEDYIKYIDLYIKNLKNHCAKHQINCIFVGDRTKNWFIDNEFHMTCYYTGSTTEWW